MQTRVIPFSPILLAVALVCGHTAHAQTPAASAKPAQVNQPAKSSGPSSGGSPADVHAATSASTSRQKTIENPAIFSFWQRNCSIPPGEVATNTSLLSLLLTSFSLSMARDQILNCNQASGTRLKQDEAETLLTARDLGPFLSRIGDSSCRHVAEEDVERSRLTDFFGEFTTWYLNVELGTLRRAQLADLVSYYRTTMGHPQTGAEVREQMTDTSVAGLHAFLTAEQVRFWNWNVAANCSGQ